MIIIIIAAIALAVLAGQLIMCFKIKHIIPKIIPAAVISLLGISFFAVTAGNSPRSRHCSMGDMGNLPGH